MPLQDVGIRYEVEIEGEDDAISRAADIDAAYQSIASTIDALPDVDISVAADVDEGSITDFEATLEGIADGEYVATASAEVDDSEIIPFDQELTDVDETIATATANAEVDDSEIIPFDALLDETDEKTATATVDAEKTDEAEATFSLLDAIKAGIVLTAIINVAGTIVDAIHAIEGFTITPFLDVDEASAAFAAHTGIANENISDMIFGIHQADLGDFTDIERVLERAQQLNAPLEEAATAALTFTKTFSDQNPVDILTQMNQLVELGLVDSFGEAADVMTGAFQDGANRAGDLLPTLERYAPMFAAMGINAQEAMALLNGGLDVGFRNTQDFARNLETMQQNIINGSQDAESEIAQLFDRIGVELPAQGEDMGTEFFQNVIAGIQKLPAGEVDAAITSVFGQRAGGTEAILDIQPNVEPITGNEAEEAAAALDDHLRGVFDDIGLELETIAQEFLSSEQIDLPGKINAIKEGLQTALEDVAAGMSLGEAIEHGLKIEGLAEFITNFESGIGNLEIIFLQVVASLADLIGQGGAAASARAEVARLGAGQLAFDLQLQDDGAGILLAVQTAVQRGVDEGDIGGALQTALDEALARGDFALAQTITDTIAGAAETAQQQAAAITRGGAFGAGGVEVPVTFGEFDPAAAQEQITSVMAEMGVAMSEAMAAGDFATAIDLAEQLGMSDATIIMLTNMAKEAGAGVKDGMDEAALATEQAGDRIHNKLVGQSVTTDLAAVANAARMHLPAAAAQFRMIEQQASTSFRNAASYVTVLTDAIITGMGNALPVLDAAINKLIQLAAIGTTANAVMGAAVTQANSLAAAGAGGGGGNTTNINLNQTNNINNPAAGANVANQTATAVRGF